MTDSEIIKELKRMSEEDAEGFSSDVLDLIKRQQAEIEICAETIKRQDKEIERLKKENKILSKNADTAFQDGLNEAQDLYAEQVKNEVRTKAIKEFAEKLKSEYSKPDLLLEQNIIVIEECELNEIVKKWKW